MSKAKIEKMIKKILKALKGCTVETDRVSIDKLKDGYSRSISLTSEDADWTYHTEVNIFRIKKGE